MKTVNKPPDHVDRTPCSPATDRETVTSPDPPKKHRRAEHPHRRHRLCRAGQVEALTSSSVNDVPTETQAPFQKTPQIGPTST